MTSYYLDYPPGTHVWIGGQDKQKNSSLWKWEDGSLIDGYNNFDPSSPEPEKNDSHGNCLQVIFPDDLTWKKTSCKDVGSYGFIAEKRKS